MPSKTPPEIREARFCGKQFRALTSGSSCSSWQVRAGPLRCVVRHWHNMSTPWAVLVWARWRKYGAITLHQPGCRRELVPALAAAEAACRLFHERVGKALGVE